MAFFNNQPIEYTVVEQAYPDGVLINDEQGIQIIYSGKKNANYNKVPVKNIPDFVDFENLFFEDGRPLETEGHSGLTINLKNEEDYGNTVVSNKVKFIIKHIDEKGKDAYWIQLIDKNSDKESGHSPLD